MVGWHKEQQKQCDLCRTPFLHLLRQSKQQQQLNRRPWADVHFNWHRLMPSLELETNFGAQTKDQDTTTSLARRCRRNHQLPTTVSSKRIAMGKGIEGGPNTNKLINSVFYIY